jgi:hypothetical protein
LFVNDKVPHRAKRGAHEHTEKLKNHESVCEMKCFLIKFLNWLYLKNVYLQILWTEQQVSKARTKRDHNADVIAKRAENLVYRSANFDDPEWSRQWYLKNEKNSPNKRSLERLDLHVVPAWALGYTGKNVIVTVLDDGKFDLFL